MKVFLLSCLLACVTWGPVLGETSVQAPYPPSGWKPDGPSFDLPPRTPSQNTFAQQTSASDFNSYLPPDQNKQTDLNTGEQVDNTTPIGDNAAPTEMELSVQGLPSREADQTFRQTPPQAEHRGTTPRNGNGFSGPFNAQTIQNSAFNNFEQPTNQQPQQFGRVQQVFSRSNVQPKQANFKQTSSFNGFVQPQANQQVFSQQQRFSQPNSLNAFQNRNNFESAPVFQPQGSTFSTNFQNSRFANEPAANNNPTFNAQSNSNDVSFQKQQPDSFVGQNQNTNLTPRPFFNNNDQQIFTNTQFENDNRVSSRKETTPKVQTQQGNSENTQEQFQNIQQQPALFNQGFSSNFKSGSPQFQFQFTPNVEVERQNLVAFQQPNGVNTQFQSSQVPNVFNQGQTFSNQGFNAAFTMIPSQQFIPQQFNQNAFVATSQFPSNVAGQNQRFVSIQSNFQNPQQPASFEPQFNAAFTQQVNPQTNSVQFFPVNQETARITNQPGNGQFAENRGLFSNAPINVPDFASGQQFGQIQFSGQQQPFGNGQSGFQQNNFGSTDPAVDSLNSDQDEGVQITTYSGFSAYGAPSSNQYGAPSTFINGNKNINDNQN